MAPLMFVTQKIRQGWKPAGALIVREFSMWRWQKVVTQYQRAQIARFGRGLTAVMIAAIAKIMDAHELIHAGRKLVTSATARTTIGLPNKLSSRLQPNLARAPE